MSIVAVWPGPAFRLCGLCYLVSILAPTVCGAAAVGRPEPGKGPTQVRIQLGVIDVDEIDSAKQTFTANLFLEARWHDPRLAHDDAGDVAHPLDSVWHPRLQIVNQRRVVRTFPEVVEVSPNGDVVYHQRLWGPFSQPLDVRDFPFDRQLFRIRLVAAGYAPTEVEIVQNTDVPPKVAPQLSVADWTLDDWNEEPQAFPAIGSSELVPGYILTFEGRREFGYYLLKVVLPLVLIVAMSWTVFWITPEQSGTQISVSVTSMLTLIAYRFMVGGSLPTISYLTRMDYFILGSMILVFITLVEAVATAVLVDKDRTTLAKRVDVWCRWLLPSGFVVVCLLSFLL